MVKRGARFAPSHRRDAAGSVLFDKWIRQLTRRACGRRGYAGVDDDAPRGLGNRRGVCGTCRDMSRHVAQAAEEIWDGAVSRCPAMSRDVSPDAAGQNHSSWPGWKRIFMSLMSRQATWPSRKRICPPAPRLKRLRWLERWLGQPPLTPVKRRLGGLPVERLESVTSSSSEARGRSTRGRSWRK